MSPLRHRRHDLVLDLDPDPLPDHALGLLGHRPFEKIRPRGFQQWHRIPSDCVLSCLTSKESLCNFTTDGLDVILTCTKLDSLIFIVSSNPS